MLNNFFLKPFLAALQFLTIIPAGKTIIPEGRDFSRSLIYFPITGWVLSFLLIIFSYLTRGVLNDLALSCMLVVIMAVVTGGLHLDGVADTFDALGSRRDKNKMLEIMRDSRIGAMGVMALVSVMMLKAALLASFSFNVRNAALIVIMVVSRWVMVWAIKSFSYARSEGKAKAFFSNIEHSDFYISTAAALLLVFCVARFDGIFLMIIAALCVYAFCFFIARKLGGITGDVLGAVCELTEVLSLILFAIFLRF